MAKVLSARLNDEEDIQRGRFLTFFLGNEEYGIDITTVTEIIGMQPISALPEVPEYVRGIVNLRGRVIPVIDMRLKFKKAATGYTDRTCIIVINTGAFSAGLIVDGVAEVTALEDSEIVPPPDVRTGIQNRYLMGIGKKDGRIKLLLDCDMLFQKEEIQGLDNNKEGLVNEN